MMKATSNNKPTLGELRELTLFRHFSEEHLAQLCELTYCKSFPAGASLMLVEQVGEVVYLILNGTVKVHIEQADGTEVIISLLGQRRIIVLTTITSISPAETRF